MKKLIALILALMMVLSLAACGADTMIGSNMSISIKGSGKSKLTVTVTDKFEEDYKLEYVLCEEDAQFFTVTGVKETEDTHTYAITPNAPGNHTFAVKYMNGDELLGTASLNVIVAETLKMYYSDISLADIDDLFEELGGGGVISSEDGGIKTVKLSNADGDWLLGKYDENVLSVDGPDISYEENTSSFIFTAVGEGETVAYLRNKDAGIQMLLNFKSSKLASGDIENPEFNLTLMGCSKEALNSDSTPIGADKTDADKIKEALGDQFIVPEGAEIEDAIYFGDLESVDEFEDKPDILSDMTFTFNGIAIDYQTSKTLTKADYDIGATEAELPVVESKDLKIGNYDVTYYFLQKNLGIATWERDGIASRMTFYDASHTSQELQDVLTLLLEADAL